MTKIEWTRGDDGSMGETWNPVVGCSRVSEGCRHCYAERQAFRNEAMGWNRYKGLTKKVGGEIRWTGVVELIPQVLNKPLRWKKPRRIFVNSMSDLFHESLPDEAIDQVFAVMALARQHTFQVLTKRPERMRDYCERTTVSIHAVDFLRSQLAPSGQFGEPHWQMPLPNVWLGVSVEDQPTADERIPLLLQTPAAVRFVSYEPALAAVDFTRLRLTGSIVLDALRRGGAIPGLDWVIVGGESGPGARPFDLAWARSTVAQCRAAGVPVFVKQLGSKPIGCLAERDGDDYEDDHCDGYEASESAPCPGRRCVLHALEDRKGGEPEEWPEDLRVREFPA